MNFENFNITNLYFVLHVIGFVTWVAGLLYLGRVLVYHSQAFDKNEEEKNILTAQFLIMERRVNRFIAFPGMLLTIIMGLLLMSATKAYFFPWFHVKLLLILIMIILHFFHGLAFVKFKKSKSNESPLSTFKMKLLNEAVTLNFVLIVLTVYLREPQQFLPIWVVVIVLFVLGFFLTNSRSRNKKKTEVN